VGCCDGAAGAAATAGLQAVMCRELPAGMLARRQGVLTSTAFIGLLPSLRPRDTDPGSKAGLNLPAASLHTDARVCMAVTLALTRCSVQAKQREELCTLHGS
jgi:hypothetical protein